MKTAIQILLFLPALCFGQNEIPNPAEIRYFLAYDSISGVYHAGEVLPGQFMSSGQPDLIQAIDEVQYLQLTDQLPIQYDSLPDEGEWVEKAIYEYEEKLVVCRQAHSRTIFTPEETPALFAIYRPEGSQYLTWIVGEIVYIGQIRSYEDLLYECIQTHQTVIGQTPDILPALWNTYSDEECPEWVQPTGAQDAYDVGDCVTYQGQEWINTSPANVFAPGVFGWVLK